MQQHDIKHKESWNTLSHTTKSSQFFECRFGSIVIVIIFVVIIVFD
jgi:hypothetical protein